MRITDYQSITSFASDDAFVVDGTANGTRKILTKDAVFAMFDQVAPEMHRTIFRGKNLGTSLTQAQKTAIQNGTFTDLWLGDYWVINGVNWRIADIDYWMNAGDTSFTQHHLVIIPDNYLYTAPMNATNTTTGGYMGSQMYTSGLTNAKNTISGIFGSSLLTHREYLSNAVSSSSGYPTGGAWVDSTVEIPNEIMLFGSHINAAWGADVSRYTIDKTQLALFAICPRFLNTGTSYWTRDTYSTSRFACVGYYGTATQVAASTSSYGVRPVFAIG